VEGLHLKIANELAIISRYTYYLLYLMME